MIVSFRSRKDIPCTDLLQGGFWESLWRQHL